VATETVASERQILPTVEKFLAGRGFTESLLDDIARAGWHIRPSEFVGLSLALMGVGAMFGTMITTRLGVGALLGLIGIALPRVYLASAIGSRKKAFESQIPEMVMLVTSALKSGYSFLRALQVASRELPSPMSELTKRVVEESQYGVPLQDALQRMATRVRSYDMDLIATAVIIQSQVGGSLAEVLESIGGTIRERIQIQSEVSALTAEGRLSGIVLLLLPPVIAGVLTLVNPSYMGTLFREPLGVKLVIGAVVMEGIGMLWIRKMLKIDI
jgi:tight adherence protein B